MIYTLLVQSVFGGTQTTQNVTQYTREEMKEIFTASELEDLSIGGKVVKTTRFTSATFTDLVAFHASRN